MGLQTFTNNWQSVLRADPIEWLLEEDNPSVRYITLTDILDKPDTDHEVLQTKTEIMKNGMVPKILSKQTTEGVWESSGSFYSAKYKGTVWQLIILAELSADGNDEGIRKACEFILANTQDRESGGFAMNTSAKTGGGRHSEVIPCLTGNMIWSLIHLGYLEDQRVQQGIDWITRYQRFDDGIVNGPKGWPYDKYETCWGKHTCHMGVVKTLKALAAIPRTQRSCAVDKTIEQGIEYILNHHIFKKSHDLNSVSKPGWLRFGFPLMYQTDVLEVVMVLNQLKVKDDRMQEAVDLIISKQDLQGRWNLENTYNGRFQVNIEQKAKPSKWITLRALRVIKDYIR